MKNITIGTEFTNKEGLRLEVVKVYIKTTTFDYVPFIGYLAPKEDEKTGKITKEYEEIGFELFKSLIKSREITL